MANTIKKGESLFIPFENGESIYDSQLKPRMYKTKEQYEKYSYRFGDAEMVEYAEVVRCKDCRKFTPFVEPYDSVGQCRRMNGLIQETDFCSYGERKDNGTV